MSILQRLRHLLSRLDRTLRHRATATLAWEHRELENLLALVLLCPAAGLPGPPATLALELLPHLERELVVLLARARHAGDPLGELFSTFDVT